MISADIQAATLEEFYNALVEAQRKAHGGDYCIHHEVIRQLARTDWVYVELGVNQGATLACAALANYNRVWGYDIKIDPIKRYWHLFEQSGYKIDVRRLDSRNPLPLGGADFLFIDSVHTAVHLRSELKVHADQVRHHILVHDTGTHLEMLRELITFCNATPDWEIIATEARGVGHTLLQRTK